MGYVPPSFDEYQDPVKLEKWFQRRCRRRSIMFKSIFLSLFFLLVCTLVWAQPTSSTISPSAFGSKSWRENGLSPLSLPLTGNLLWDVRLASDAKLYYWDGNEWTSVIGNSSENGHLHFAETIEITDPGSFYAAENIEDALSEIGAEFDTISLDPRWSDAREPFSHATSHAQGGGDPLSGTLNVNIAGNSATSTTSTTSSSLVANPTDCVSGQYAHSIDSQGNLTCSVPSGGGTPEITDLNTLQGIIIWLKADAITGLSDGDPVSTWLDSSTGARHFTQATAGLRPTYRMSRLNSLPTVVFDGGDCLAHPSISLSTFSVFIVFYAQNLGLLYEHSPNLNSASAGSFLYTDRNDTSRVERNGGIQSSRNLITWDVSGAPAAWGAQMEWNIVSQTFGGSGQHKFHRLRVNGGVPMQATTMGGDPGTSTATDEMNLGCRDESAAFLNGEIAEFAVFSPALTAAQIRDVEAYLRTKWGL